MGNIGGLGQRSIWTTDQTPPPTPSLGKGGMGGGFFGGLATGLTPAPTNDFMEVLNQKFNRPNPDMQGPVAPIGGVSLRNRLMGQARKLFQDGGE